LWGDFDLGSLIIIGGVFEVIVAVLLLLGVAVGIAVAVARGGGS
jgi:hypothetical protein